MEIEFDSSDKESGTNQENRVDSNNQGQGSMEIEFSSPEIHNVEESQENEDEDLGNLEELSEEFEDGEEEFHDEELDTSDEEFYPPEEENHPNTEDYNPVIEDVEETETTITRKGMVLLNISFRENKGCQEK